MPYEKQQYIKKKNHITTQGAGIAQWLEHRTRDWKVAGSNPCWNGGRIFFSRVDFLCWLLFRYPFHPRVTIVARKKSRPFCQKCRWQVTAKHAYTLRMCLLLNRASAFTTHHHCYPPLITAKHAYTLRMCLLLNRASAFTTHHHYYPPLITAKHAYTLRMCLLLNRASAFTTHHHYYYPPLITAKHAYTLRMCLLLNRASALVTTCP